MSSYWRCLVCFRGWDSDVRLLEMFGLFQFQRVGSDVKLLEMFGLFQRVGQ